MAENRAYVAWSDGLEILDVQHPEAPRPVGRLGLRASLHDVAVDGSHLIVAAGSHGLLVVDVGDPEEPEAISRLDTPGSVRSVAWLPPYAYLADGSAGLQVVDLRHPERPRRIASWSTRGQVRAVAVAQGVLVTAEGSAGARVFDLTRPDRPIEVGPLDSGIHALDVAAIPPWIAVATPGGEIRLYRIDDRLRPILERTVVLSDEIAGLSAGESGVWAAGGARGGWWVDPTGTNPPLEVVLPRGTVAGSGEFVDGILYFAAGPAGLAVVEFPSDGLPRVLVPQERTIRIEWE